MIHFNEENQGDGKREEGQEKWGAQKKERFIIMALAGILLLVICLPVKKTGQEGRKMPSETEEAAGGQHEESGALPKTDEKAGMKPSEGADEYAAYLERQLEETLSCVDGAGRVKVMITLKTSGEEVVEKDMPANRSNVTENDSAGGSRSSSEMESGETTVYITDQDGRQTPYVKKTIHPAVEGVVVIASGGGNGTVKKNITEAIQALFDIEPHKIKVIKMKTLSK